MLKDQMVRSGNFLFRWRSYLPLIMLPVLLSGLFEFGYPKDNHDLDLAWEFGCLGLAGIGELIRIITVGFAPRGTSGRNTKSIKAPSLSVTGMYSLVRHPLYLGNFLICVALALFLRSWWIVLVTGLVYWLYYERIIMAEEEFLERAYGDSFRRWAQRTPAILPRPGGWVTPEFSFSFKSTIRREYATCFLILCIFTVLEVVGDYALLGRFVIDPIWGVLFGTGLVLYVATRFLKKRTSVLQVAGR